MNSETLPSVGLSSQSSNLDSVNPAESQALDRSDLSHSPSDADSVTAVVAAVVGSGLAGAAIGHLLGGRAGAAVGAVVGGITGAAIAHDSDPQSSEATLTPPPAKGTAPTPETMQDTPPVAEAMLDSADAPQRIQLAETHYQLGVTLARQGHFDDAIEEFEDALHYAPESAETHYNLGVAYSKQGDLDQALNHMHQAEELCEAQEKEVAVKVIEQTIDRLDD